MTQHTPAPWINTNSRYIDSLAGHRVAEVYNHAPGYLENAALIAAAPELLDALKALFDNCEMVHKHWGDGSNQKEADAAFAAARAAIQKAQPDTQDPDAAPKAYPEPLPTIPPLELAALRVVDAWESGDLAGAVRNLSAVLKEIEA